MATLTNLKINLAPLFRQDGEMDRDMKRRAGLVAARERQSVVVKDGGLRGSISEPIRAPGLAWIVRADVPYALWIYRGYRNDPRFGLVRVKVGARPTLVESLQAAL